MIDNDFQPTLDSSTRDNDFQAMLEEARLALEKSQQALQDWVATYTADMCSKETQDAARERIRAAGGTLAYIAARTRENNVTLGKLNDLNRAGTAPSAPSYTQLRKRYQPCTVGQRPDGSVWISFGKPEKGPHYQTDFGTNIEIARAVADAFNNPSSSSLGLDAMAEKLLVAITSCSHEIDANAVVLNYSDKQPGHNAYNQLFNRVKAALHPSEAPQG